MSRPEHLRFELVMGCVVTYVLLLAGCGQARSSDAVGVPDPGNTDFVYSIPNGNNADSLYAREVVTSTQNPLGPDRLLLAYAGPAYPIETHTSASPGAWQIAAADIARGSTDGIPLNISGTQSASWSVTGGPFLARISAVDVNGVVAFDSREGVTTLSPGGVTRSFTIIPPVPGTPSLDGHPLPIVPDPGPALAEAILFAPDGHLIAATGNGVNGEVLDLTAGRRLDLPGYGFIEGMSLATDGNLYIVGRDGSRSMNPYTFLVVSYNPLALVTVAATPFVPMGGTASTLATTDKAAYLYVAAAKDPANPGGAENYELFSLPFEGLVVQAVPVQTNGEFMHELPGGTLAFYGGTAQNTLTTWDPTAGSMTSASVSSSIGPAGSYITAVFQG